MTVRFTEEKVRFTPDAQQSEDSIADSRGVHPDELMADDFDMNKYLEQNGVSLDNVPEEIDKSELTDEMKLDSFFRSMGVEQQNQEAARTALMATTNEQSAKGVFDSMKEGWNNGKIDIQTADIGMAGLLGQMTDEQVRQETARLEKTKTVSKKTWAGSWFGSAANVAPTTVEALKSGAVGAAVGAGVGAGTAVVAGQLGPQVAIPEEIATVPAGALTGGRLGMMIGSAKRGMEIEGGLMYVELLNMTDENGQHIDPKIAKPIAWTVGAINGGLEFVKLKTLISTIPGGKKLFANAQRKAVSEIVKSKTLRSVITAGAKRYAAAVGTETFTEVMQEADNIIFGIFGKHLSNEINKTKLTTDVKKDVVDRLLETTKESAKSFSLLTLPGSVVQTTTEAATIAKKEPTQPVTAEVPGSAIKETVPGLKVATEAFPQDNRISRVMASEKIIPRVDIDSLGKVMIDEPVEMPAKEPRKKVEKVVVEEELSPEDVALFQQAESEMAALETFQTIKPNLYIGNVTARMKAAMGEAMDADPEQIQGFHEGAWPTKRTKVEMTMDEGRAVLYQLETSLQERVDKDQLHNDSDLARANADWGDIAALRKELGLPKGERPFRVTRETGPRIITIEKTKERIEKTTEAGALDITKTTKIQQLNDVMKRVAKYAKEGYKAGKREVRESIALVRYLRKQKQLRDKLVEKITKDVSDKVDFFYREAIQSLQDAVDWKTGTEKAKEKKAATKKALELTPENYMNAPVSLIESFNKKNVGDLGYNDLFTVNNEIQRLRGLGLLKSKSIRAERAAKIEAETKVFTENINKAKGKNAIVSAIQALTLKPMRIFDMLDGGKNFAGRMFKFFYEITNDNYNREIQNVDARTEGVRRKMQELGISLRDMASKRMIDGVAYTVDEMLTVYAGWKNWAHQQKIRFGGIQTRYNKKPITVDDALYGKMMEQLSENQKTWADTIIAEYGQNAFDRLRNSVIAAENRDMGYEENYTPAPAANRQYVSTEEELLAEMSFRHFIRTVGPSKGMTIQRQDIPPEHQNPIRSGLTELWFESVKKQEHYINNALHIKDMQAMLRNKELRTAITDKFGDSMAKTVDDYVARIANPNFYKTYDEISRISKVLRKNAAMAYISWNFSSVFNQIPAIMSYWVNSSAMDVIQSMMNAAFHPVQAYEKAREIHYQISHNTIEREMIELEQADTAAFQKIINTIGRTGMIGLVTMDRAIRIIGINAVYDYQIRKGLSAQEARKKAADTTLMTQEAAAPKDLARLWATDEKLNWLLMFTNQLNQIYNITTYDIPASWKNSNYRDAARSAISLGTMAMMIWMIQNGRLPEDEEDAADALTDEFVSMLPLIGSWINAARNGWDTELPFQTVVTQTTKGLNKIAEGELEKGLEKLIEPMALLTGYPYQGTKELYRFIEGAD